MHYAGLVIRHNRYARSEVSLGVHALPFPRRTY